MSKHVLGPNVPHVNKTVTDFGGIYTDIPPRRYAPDFLRSSILAVQLTNNFDIKTILLTNNFSGK